MKRNQTGTALIIVGVLCLLSAAALWGYNTMQERTAGETVREVLQEIAPPVNNPDKP